MSGGFHCFLSRKKRLCSSRCGPGTAVQEDACERGKAVGILTASVYLSNGIRSRARAMDHHVSPLPPSHRLSTSHFHPRSPLHPFPLPLTPP